jgi:hypothetical protein
VLRAVRVRGLGRVVVPAHGVADAEHLVEKELTRLWPQGRVRIERVARAGGGRVVEEFAIDYRLEGEREVQVERPEDAPAAAFRELNGLLEGSRYQRIEWGNGEE